MVGKTCYAQTDRLVNSDNSTESPTLKARGGGSLRNVEMCSHSLGKR